MTEQSKKAVVSSQQVAEYLKEHPDFLLQNDEVLSQLNLVQPVSGAVSLLTRQQQLLREKNYQLEQKMATLISTAQRNENLYKVFIDLYLQLIECPDSSRLLFLLNKVLLEQMQLDGMRLILFMAGGDEETAALVEPRHSYQGILQERLKHSAYYFGRLKQPHMEMFFKPEEAIRSVALIRLGENKEMGLLAFGSRDESHFHGDMDTLFLDPMVKLINRLILNFAKENREIG